MSRIIFQLGRRTSWHEYRDVFHKNTSIPFLESTYMFATYENNFNDVSGCYASQ